ncbi:hypothetical protein [Nesterenkonia muleiensis]|uniref:hypothetical protein n=1 Tax=Nesterenkonia muleiensis TaxID=2282648 RepID=UPI000E72046A|nr:hypothetical protein [Nesterenkonia muleiensis]
MATQIQTDTAEQASLKTTSPTPLGSPHSGVAAVLVTLSWAALFFFAGLSFAEHGSVPLVGLLGVALAAVASQAYLVRAHTPGFWVRSQQIRTAPALAAGAAFGVTVGLVTNALYRGMDGDLVVFGMGCLAIATLAVAPAQMILSGSARTSNQQEASASPG